MAGCMNTSTVIICYNKLVLSWLVLNIHLICLLWVVTFQSEHEHAAEQCSVGKF